jgi:hypothetical protein
MDVVVWLRSLGLGKYEVVFRRNAKLLEVLRREVRQDARAGFVSALSAAMASSSLRRCPSVPQRVSTGGTRQTDTSRLRARRLVGSTEPRPSSACN